MAWNTSNRGNRLPKNWPSIRSRVLREEPTCRLAYDGCTRKSTQVDHKNAGDNHSRGNLQGVCARCHATKSSREGRQAQLRRKALGKRPPERHPGLKK